MKNHSGRYLGWLAAVLIGLLSSSFGAAQAPPVENGRPPAGLKVFLSGPEASSYAADIPFAAVVPGREGADVAVDIVPSQAGEGPLVTLTFAGQGKFEGNE